MSGTDESDYRNSFREIPLADTDRLPPACGNGLFEVSNLQPALNPSAFLLGDLPGLNNAVLRGDLSLQAFLDRVHAPVAALMVEAARPGIDRDGARLLLQQLGMFLSSAERHAQAAGQPPGAAVARFAGVDASLDHLGRVADHPPRDSAYTYWIWNQAGYTFTGDPQERLFAQTVAGTVESVEGACRSLRFVASPATPLASPDVVRYMEQAADLQELSYRLLATLGKHEGATRAPTFSGEFFTFNFRTWLTTWPVAGRKWEGPSAANFGAFWEADVRLIPTPPFYRHYVEGRLHTLPGEERSRVRAAMSAATVEDRILTCLGIDAARALVLDDATLDRLVRTAGISAFLTALDRYVAITTRWTKVHLALVKKKLEEPANAAAHLADRLPVDPNLGTGGGDWRKELLQILEMRANPPVLLQLFRVNRRANPAGGGQPDGRAA